MLLLQLARPIKAIADELERHEATISGRLKAIRRKAAVDDNAQLLLWALQNPACVQRDGLCRPGLHPDACPCGSPLCSSRVRGTAA